MRAKFQNQLWLRLVRGKWDTKRKRSKTSHDKKNTYNFIGLLFRLLQVLFTLCWTLFDFLLLFTRNFGTITFYTRTLRTMTEKDRDPSLVVPPSTQRKTIVTGFTPYTRILPTMTEKGRDSEKENCDKFQTIDFHRLRKWNNSERNKEEIPENIPIHLTIAYGFRSDAW